MTWSVAREALLNAAEDLGWAGDNFQSAITDQTAGMGNLSWPLTYFMCQAPYNSSLDAVRDAARDLGTAVVAVADKMKEVHAAYERLEQLNEVK